MAMKADGRRGRANTYYQLTIERGIIVLSERTIKALDGNYKCSINGKARVRKLFEIITRYPDLWMQVYANIYANDGANTKGIKNAM